MRKSASKAPPSRAAAALAEMEQRLRHDNGTIKKLLELAVEAADSLAETQEALTRLKAIVAETGMSEPSLEQLFSHLTHFCKVVRKVKLTRPMQLNLPSTASTRDNKELAVSRMLAVRLWLLPDHQALAGLQSATVNLGRCFWLVMRLLCLHRYLSLSNSTSKVFKGGYPVGWRNLFARP